MGNKLFLISYYFAPLGRADGVNRTYLVKHLAELGWDIEVISCANPHALLRNFHRDESLLKILPSGVRHHRVRSTYWGPLGGVASLLGMADDPFGNWRWPVLRQARALFHVPGILYAVVPPVVNATIAWEIARDKKYPLVIDFRDNEFKIPPSVVNDAGTIIASTQQSLDEMRRFYRLGNDRGIEVQNGYPEDLRLLPVKQRGRPGQLRIVYAGLLNLEQDPAVLARAVRFMERRYPETRTPSLWTISAHKITTPAFFCGTICRTPSVSGGTDRFKRYWESWPMPIWPTPPSERMRNPTASHQKYFNTFL